MYPPIPRLADFDVSPLNGFLPTEPPCQHLADLYYAPWEGVISSLQPLILTKRLRSVVNRLPILSTDYLLDEAEWRRAYSILGFVVHGYIWGGDSPADVIPPPLSIPFLQVCQHLELPAVASYAGEVLWNWSPLVLSEPVDSLENISILHTITGSLDETWFFSVSAAIEARGAPIIPLMLDAVSAARYNDEEAVIEALRSFAERIDELGILLNRMYENCDPHVFYHRIRPYLAGSKNMAEAGLPNGVMFDTGSGQDDYVQYAGGSNAQSSIIQFFDIILGVEHHATGSQPGTPNVNFIHEMRKYMPGRHRRFLEQTERIANIRPFVVARADNAALRIAYDACLAMLRNFRDLHIQMVSRYIIVKSRESSRNSASIPPGQAPVRKNLAVASTVTGASSLDEKASAPRTLRKLKGTGGTALIPFLKQARDETGEPAIDAWARRLLNNGPGHVPRSIDPVLGSGLAAKAESGVRLPKMGEHASGEREILGLAGVWRVDDSEGGICHW